MISSELEKIKQFCLAQGFDLVGFCKAEIPEKDRNNLLSWVEQGFFGKMSWYTKEVSQEIRLDLKHLGFFPKSVLVLAVVYNSPAAEETIQSQTKKVSRYALGDDYHSVLRKKANPILNELKSLYPNHSFRQSVDSLPVPEKVFARLAGIGWMGKNTNIINEELGSYFFISTILTDCEWEIPLQEEFDRCGSCRACLDACPTGALFEPYKINANKCISHHTIEDRNILLNEETKLSDWIYGCDICQEVCPWNKTKARRNSVKTSVDEFLPYPFWKEEDLSGEKVFSDEEFQSKFKQSAIKRIGSLAWNRNLKSVPGSKEINQKEI